MRTLLTSICLALLVLVPAAARCADVLILQSSRAPAYGDALRGFRLAFKGTEQTLLLSDYAEVDVQRIVREERPRLVLAVGDGALSASRKVREVPVLSMLALTLNLARPVSDNVGGVAMAAAPEQYLKLFASLGAKRVGVLYDPKRTGQYLKRAAQAAREQGLQLVAEPVDQPRGVQARLEGLRGEVDALWLLPDSTVVNTVNMEALLLFSLMQNVPAVSFTNLYLKSGAAASLDVDPYDIGVQTGEMAMSVLRGSGRRIPVLDPRKVQLHTNDGVLRKLRNKGGE